MDEDKCGTESVEWKTEETTVLEENLHHFVHHKSHIAWPCLEPGQPQWEARV
jgi:hypothetical protein